jgi:hypothetical protein
MLFNRMWLSLQLMFSPERASMDLVISIGDSLLFWRVCVDDSYLTPCTRLKDELRRPYVSGWKGAGGSCAARFKSRNGIWEYFSVSLLLIFALGLLFRYPVYCLVGMIWQNIQLRSKARPTCASSIWCFRNWVPARILCPCSWRENELHFDSGIPRCDRAASTGAGWVL